MYFRINSCRQTTLPARAKYFKEELIDDILEIPETKPKMSKVLDVIACAEIENFELIETEIGFSNEGQRLTGRKLITEIKIKEKVTYVASVPEQSGHAIQYESFKNMVVILPEKVEDKYTCDLIRANRVQIVPYIEEICYRQLSEKEIHVCIMLFVDVKMA